MWRLFQEKHLGSRESKMSTWNGKESTWWITAVTIKKLVVKTSNSLSHTHKDKHPTVFSSSAQTASEQPEIARRYEVASALWWPMSLEEVVKIRPDGAEAVYPLSQERLTGSRHTSSEYSWKSSLLFYFFFSPCHLHNSGLTWTCVCGWSSTVTRVQCDTDLKRVQSHTHTHTYL